jgi:hypothetical protein
VCTPLPQSLIVERDEQDTRRHDDDGRIDG